MKLQPVCLCVAIALICVFVGESFAQTKGSKSSRRKNEDDVSVDFPLNENEPSLLSRMTEGRQTNAVSMEMHVLPTEMENQFRGSRYSESITPVPDTKPDGPQYPLYDVRDSQNRTQQLEIKHQRSVHVSSSQPARTDGRRRSTNNRTRNSRNSSGQRKNYRGNPPRSLANRNENQKPAEPLFSVLESTQPAPTPQQTLEVPVPGGSNGRSVLSNGESDAAVVETPISDNARRPKDILLGTSDIEPEAVAKNENKESLPQNIFNKRPEQKRPDRVARKKVVFENFSDSDQQAYPIQRPQQRLRFEKPDPANISKLVERSGGIVQRIEKNSLPDILDLEPLEAMESEEFDSTTIKNENVEQPASPSDLWLNKRSRYNFSDIKPAERKPIKGDAPKQQIETAPQAKLNAIQMSFGDQDPVIEENVFEGEPIEALEPSFAYEDEMQTGEEPVEEIDDEEVAAQARQEAQRQSYRNDLRNGLPPMPTQMVSSYIDDEGKSIPSTRNQKHYLSDFGGFDAIGFVGNGVRTDVDGACWWPKCAVWASPDFCHKALYFEDYNLERHGVRYPALQPAISAAHFFGSTIRLPYMMGLDPLHECQFSAGHGRPGNKACYQRERFVWSPRAGTFQALLIAGAVYALP